MRSSALALVASFGVLLLPGFSQPAQAAKYKIRWFVGHQNPDYFEIAAKDFKNEVETRSRGEISVDIMTAVNDETHNGSSSAPEIAAQVEKGEAEMGHSFVDVVGGLDPRLYAFEAPYLMRGDRHMEAVLEGPVGEELLEGFRAHHMVGLSFTYSGGPSLVASAGREIRRPEDMKGLKIGVYGDAVNEAWLKSLGAVPVGIGHDLGSIHGLASGGSLDGVVITWQNFARTALQQDFKYMNLAGSTYLVSVTYINEKFFESLPEAYRAIIKEASRAAGRVERAKTIELNATAKRAMTGKGVRPVVLTDAGKRGFDQALRPAYEGSIERLIGRGFIERIKSTPDAPDAPLHIAGH